MMKFYYIKTTITSLNFTHECLINIQQISELRLRNPFPFALTS